MSQSYALSLYNILHISIIIPDILVVPICIPSATVYILLHFCPSKYSFFVHVRNLEIH
jgi:hypothetical protein